MRDNEQQDRCNRAFGAVLEHSDLLVDPKDVFTVVQVCRVWKQAVHQSCSSITFVSMQQACLAKISDFLGGWLPCYGSLVDTLEIMAPPGAPCGDRCGERGCQSAYSTAANWLMAMGLQAAAARNMLRLRCFSSNLVHTPAVIAALPSDTVTHLYFDMTSNSYPPAAFVGPLSALTGLRSLSLLGYNLNDPLPADYMLMISQLTRLTSLELSGIDADVDTTCLPVHLQHLYLLVRYAATAQALRTGVTINLSHLTNLQTFALDSWPHVTVGSELPPQLQQLLLDCHYKWAPVTGQARALLNTQLQQLTELDVTDLTMLGDDWQVFAGVLTALPNLSLSLTYSNVHDHDDLDHPTHHGQCVIEAAEHWHTFHQLSVLCMDNVEFADGELLRMLPSISAVPTLTELDFENVCIGGDRLRICRHLTQLTRLQKLVLDFHYAATGRVPFGRGDAKYLSSLTGLTHLDFGQSGWFDGVGDTAAVAIACELTNLRYLSMTQCGIRNASILPVISKLSALTALMLLGNDFVYRVHVSDLMMLSRLRHLQALDILNERWYDRFWAAVNGEQADDYDSEVSELLNGHEDSGSED